MKSLQNVYNLVGRFFRADVSTPFDSAKNLGEILDEVGS